MEALPKRSHDIYQEIESFEDYELTQCVAYEMAIRNDDNLKAIEEVVQYYNENNEDISKKYQTIQEKVNRIDCIDWRYNDTRLSNINKIIKKMNDFREKSMENFETTSLSTDESKIEIREGKGYSVYTNLISYGSSHVSNGLHILDNFKRPKLNINPLHSRSATIELDLNKPLSELKAYIIHVKEDLENNKDMLKAPIELIGEELQKADSLTNAVLSKQASLADMFYVYDCLKIGMSQRKIQNEVYNYYADQGIETKTLDSKTLKKYKEIAVDYIDNTRYKELITGTKLENLEK